MKVQESATSAKHVETECPMRIRMLPPWGITDCGRCSPYDQGGPSMFAGLP